MIVVMSVNNEVLTGVFQIKDSCCSASHGCHICDIQVEGWSSGLAMADILRQFSYNFSSEDKHSDCLFFPPTKISVPRLTCRDLDKDNNI